MFHYVNLPRAHRNDADYVAQAFAWCEKQFDSNPSLWNKEVNTNGIRFWFLCESHAARFRQQWG